MQHLEGDEAHRPSHIAAQVRPALGGDGDSGYHARLHVSASGLRKPQRSHVRRFRWGPHGRTLRWYGGHEHGEFRHGFGGFGYSPYCNYPYRSYGCY
jgi:hypothetical protein